MESSPFVATMSYRVRFSHPVFLGPMLRQYTPTSPPACRHPEVAAATEGSAVRQPTPPLPSFLQVHILQGLVVALNSSSKAEEENASGLPPLLGSSRKPCAQDRAGRPELQKSRSRRWRDYYFCNCSF